MHLPADIAPLLRLFQESRVSLNSEAAAQEDIGRILREGGFPHLREMNLSPTDRVDFLLESGIAIEVKVKGYAKREILRQLQRYAEHPAVTGIVLATAISIQLPAVINGKPARVASLGRAWL